MKSTALLFAAAFVSISISPAEARAAGSFKPVIQEQPVGATVLVGKGAGFYVGATGPGRLVYQWIKNGETIPGANSNLYNIPVTSAGSGGTYSVKVSNIYGSVVSANAVLTIAYPPAITQQPSSVSVVEGASAKFSVVASGTSLYYQWQRDGMDIRGATSSSYAISPVKASDGGSYRVLVYSAYGSVRSAQATLTVKPAVVGYVQPSSGICDAVKSVNGGYLCAIKPSRIDPAARDVYGSASLQDQRLGFGYHAILFPNNDRGVKGVYVHLTGSYGRAYDQRLGEFGSDNFHAENVGSGYVMIQVAYDNRFQVNDEICGTYTNIDNCAGLVRQEKLTGQDVFPKTVTPVADAIETRVKKLAEYFTATGVKLPVPLVVNGQVNWKALRVGGHSQGAGHAYFIAKNKGVSHACLLGGPYDAPDTVGTANLIADWFKVPGSVTPVSAIRAAVSQDDGSYNHFTYAYSVIGLQYQTGWFDFSAAPYFDADGNEVDGHRAVMEDPRFAALRTQVCFK